MALTNEKREKNTWESTNVLDNNLSVGGVLTEDFLSGEHGAFVEGREVEKNSGQEDALTCKSRQTETKHTLFLLRRIDLPSSIQCCSFTLAFSSSSPSSSSPSYWTSRLGSLLLLYLLVQHPTSGGINTNMCAALLHVLSDLMRSATTLVRAASDITRW